MSYAFKKIGATKILENAPDNANVVCEVNGDVNRIPAAKIGGGGIKVAIIKRTGSVFSCDNMTYEEAVECLINGTPLMFYIYNATIPLATLAIQAKFESDRIRIYAKGGDIYWTSSGISASSPSGGVS